MMKTIKKGEGRKRFDTSAAKPHTFSTGAKMDRICVLPEYNHGEFTKKLFSKNMLSLNVFWC